VSQTDDILNIDIEEMIEKLKQSKETSSNCWQRSGH